MNPKLNPETQALSAAPGVTSEQRRLIGVIADKIEDGTLFQSGIYPKKDLARFVRNMLDTTPTTPAASPTPTAEQAAPKAAPGPVSDDVVRDAARYQWLRRWKGQEHEPPFTVQHEMDGTLWGGDLDAAIDAARKQGANHDKT